MYNKPMLEMHLEEHITNIYRFTEIALFSDIPL